MSATLKPTLWAVSIQGPDDLVPVANYDDALALACTFNEWWREHKAQKPLSENDPRMWAVPVEYDGAAEAHAEWVKNPSPDCAPFFAAWNRRADGWQPIESAPKDGTTIILARFGEGYTEVSDGSWNQYPKHGEDGLNGFNAYLSEPTHWMPLPASPAEAS